MILKQIADCIHSSSDRFVAYHYYGERPGLRDMFAADSRYVSAWRVPGFGWAAREISIKNDNKITDERIYVKRRKWLTSAEVHDAILRFEAKMEAQGFPAVPGECNERIPVSPELADDRRFPLRDLSRLRFPFRPASLRFGG
jgi:hypothetical protein